MRRWPRRRPRRRGAAARDPPARDPDLRAPPHGPIAHADGVAGSVGDDERIVGQERGRPRIDRAHRDPPPLGPVARDGDCVSAGVDDVSPAARVHERVRARGAHRSRLSTRRAASTREAESAKAPYAPRRHARSGRLRGRRSRSCVGRAGSIGCARAAMVAFASHPPMAPSADGRSGPDRRRRPAPHRFARRTKSASISGTVWPAGVVKARAT